MRTKIKITMLGFVLLSQAFYIPHLIGRYRRIDWIIKEQESVAVGQVWAYKCSLPFHENDATSFRTVLAVTNGYVQYQDEGMKKFGMKWNCSVGIFLADSQLVTTNK